MKHILLLGAGKSTTVLIDYLKKLASSCQWQVTVADNDLLLVQSKVGEHPFVHACQLNIQDAEVRKSIIQKADLVISMMPPVLHYLVAMDCLEYKKHLLTASYADEKLRQLAPAIRQSGILFLCEMGLDPGIDHMSAMKVINSIKDKGGKIVSFQSHCGGLVAPDSDNNPWHYKISWNPRNVVLAGKAGAKFRDTTGYVINSRRVKTNYAKPETGFPGNEVRKVKYEELFNDCKEVTIAGLGKLAYYPNRNSLSYISLYGLDEIQTFVRTTLRYPEFCKGWKYVVAWKLTEEEPQYYTQDLPIALFFKQHFEKHHIAEEVKEKLESDALLKEQFNYLGLNDFSTCINKGLCSAADILQFILETKLALQPQDQDMIIMLHEIIYQQEEKLSGVNSLLIAKGNDSLHTAMAKAVGLPLGIAAKLLLEGGIKETGLQIPVIPTIYESVLKELSYQGIEFKEYAVPFPQ